MVSDEECLRRMDSGRAVREIYENAKALIAIRKRYYEVFRQMEGQENIVVVDAARSPEAVAEDVFEAVKAVFREDLH